MNKGKIKIGVGIEIFLLVVELFAFGFILSQTFSEIPSVSAQAESLPDGEMSSENVQVSDAIRDSGIGSDAQLNNEIEQTMQTGIVSPQLLNFLQIINKMIPPLPNIGGGQIGSFLSQIDGVKVCPLDKNNAICQNYLGRECAANCPGGCLLQDVSKIPLPADSQCALGTCYDPKEGTCSGGGKDGGAPKAKCEELGGLWFKKGDSKADALCRKGCCTLDGEARFTTEGECGKLINSTGLILGDSGVNFDSSLNDELRCLASVAPLQEGACVYPSIENPGKNECKFVDDKACGEVGGTFNLNYLCSNPALNTTCVKQNSANCLEGKDEIYWFDSCGNRENIFDSDKDKSWNNGMVLPKSESCELGTAANPVANFATCGNCNRLSSSYCGNKTSEQEIPGQEVVCRDMGCKIHSGTSGLVSRRENGESWCAYDSSIGLIGPDFPGMPNLASFLPQNPIDSLPYLGLRSTDTPGSRHFRVVCQNGEITVSPCADFRNEVCVEKQTPKGIDPNSIDLNLLATNPEQFFAGIDNAFKNTPNLFAGTLSTASCRTNRWQECFAYNPNQMEGRMIGMAGEKSSLVLKLFLEMKCGKDPDCFVKDVKVDDKFEFSYCVPRYKEGFDLRDNPQAAEQICKQGSQSCTAVFIKKEKSAGSSLVGQVEWECEANCDCVDPDDDPAKAKPSNEFIQKMNDFCISMGDCGTHIGYTGNMPGGAGFSVRAEDCDIDDDKCGQGTSSQISGIGLESIPGIGGIAGLMHGVDPHPEDANPWPGEYIQANNLLQDKIGKFADDLFGNLGINPEQFFGNVGGGRGSGVPSFDGGFDSTTGYALAGVTGAMGASALGIKAGLGASAGAGISSAVGGSSYAVTFGGQTISQAIGPSLSGSGSLSTIAVPGGSQIAVVPSSTSITGLTQSEASFIASKYGEFGAQVTNPTASAAPTAAGASTALQGFAGATLAAAAAVAVTTLLIDVLGIGPGMSPVTGIAITSLAGGGGAMIGFAAATGNGMFGLTAAATTGVGIALVVAAVVWISVLKIFGVGEQRKVVVSFDCKPWVPPVIGDCESCGEDPLSPALPKNQKWPCTKYSCETLGQNCQFVQDSERPGEGGLCISSSLGDIAAPMLVDKRDDVLSQGFKYENFVLNKGFDVKKDPSECIDQFERVTFGFKLSEHGRCRISAVPPISLPGAQQSNTQNSGAGSSSSGSATTTNAILPFVSAQTNLPTQGQIPNAGQIQQQIQQMKPENPVFLAMAEIPGGLSKEHRVSFSSRDLQSWGYTQALTNERNEIKLYIACEDYLRNDNAANPFVVNLCVLKRDLTPVQFLDLNGLEQFLGFNTGTTNFAIRVNEAAQCKWDTGDVAYETMRNSFTGDCKTDFSGNYVCTADNVQVSPGENRICVKCKDQPNLPIENRNTNGDCFWVTLKRSPSELKIISISPGNGENLIRAVDPVEIELKVETSGGIDNGKSSCSYNVDNSGTDLMSGIEFTHTQTLTQVRAGTHTIKINCLDSAGNTAEGTSTFTLEIDNSPPNIISSPVILGQPIKLIVNTDEKATCAYTNGPAEGKEGACDFKVSESGNVGGIYTSESSLEGKRHTISISPGVKYFVKCRDELGNEPLGCSINPPIIVNNI